MDSELLVQDYLNRLEAAARVLPAARRTELVAEVRAHIETSLAEAGGSDEVTVRNVLERLGSPEEILASDATEHAVAGEPGPVSRWGALEVTAGVLIALAWPALFLPFGLVLWVGLALVGLVLVWASSVWSTRLKLIATVVVVALYATVLAANMPARGPVQDPQPSPVDEITSS